jgi:hypothetical protein
VNRFPVAVDANLLLLLVVGMTDREFISKHKRLRAFTAEDYDLLQVQLSVATEIIVTPNTLTETSNLIDHIADPARTQIYKKLQALVNFPITKERPQTCRFAPGPPRGVRKLGNGPAFSHERYISSVVVSEKPELSRLGLTDCVLLDVCSSGTPLITVDLKLYLCVLEKGGMAINFNHSRDS